MNLKNVSDKQAARFGNIVGTIVRIILELICASWCAKREGKMARLSAFMLTTDVCVRSYDLADDIF